MRRPAIAMGSFVAAINQNGRLSIARQTQVAGAVEHLSFPKISSVQIRAMRQNQRIIRQ
jgi:hypothetical protein